MQTPELAISANPGLPAPPLRLPRPVRIFFIVALTLLVLAIVCEIIGRFVLHWGAPYDSPLLHESFPDMHDMMPRFRFFQTLQFFTDSADHPCMYPAVTIVVYRFIYIFRPHSTSVFIDFAFASAIVAAALFGRELIRRGLPRLTAILFMSTVVLTSYPLWFELKQANIEMVMWIILTVGIWFFLRGRGYSAAACFGIAGAMKIYPFLFLTLFLARRRLRETAFGLAAAVAVTIPSLWLVYPNLLMSWQLTTEKTASYREVVVLALLPHDGFDHSIFSLAKALAVYYVSIRDVLDDLLTAYLIIAAIASLLAWFLRIRHLPVINQLLCVAILSILLPPTSFDYTLLHLYPAWALLVLLALRSQRQQRQVPGLVPAFVCLAILFVPQTEIIYDTFTYGGQIKAFVLFALLVIAMTYPFPTDDTLPKRDKSRLQVGQNHRWLQSILKTN